MGFLKQIVFPLLGLALLLGLSYWRLSISWHKHRKSLANEVIIKVEAFKKANNRLPEENEILFIDETGPIYYQKESNTSYIVYYGLSLGESMIYNSTTQKWQNR